MANEVGIKLTLKGLGQFLNGLALAQKQLAEMSTFIGTAVKSIEDIDKALRASGQSDLADSFNTNELIQGLAQTRVGLDSLEEQAKGTLLEFTKVDGIMSQVQNDFVLVARSALTAAADVDKAGNAARQAADDFDDLNNSVKPIDADLSGGNVAAPTLDIDQLLADAAKLQNIFDPAQIQASVQQVISSFAGLEVISDLFLKVKTSLDDAGNSIEVTLLSVVKDISIGIEKFANAFEILDSVKVENVVKRVSEISIVLSTLSGGLSTLSINPIEFAKDISAISAALSELGKAIISFGRSKSIRTFIDNSDDFVVSFNNLVSNIDVKPIISGLEPATRVIRELSETIRIFNKIGGPNFGSKSLSTDILNQKNRLAELKDETRKLSEANKEEANSIKQQNLELRKSIEERRKQTEARLAAAATARTISREQREATAQARKDAAALAKAIREQLAVDTKYYVDVLTNSTNVLDRWFGRLREVKDLLPSFKIKIEVLGIQALTRLIGLFTVVPVKIIASLVKGLYSLGRSLASLGLSGIIGLIRAFISMLMRGVVAVKNLAVAILSGLVNAIRTIASVISGGLRAIFALVAAFVRAIATIVMFVAKVTLITTAFKLMLAPVRLLTAALGMLTAVFAKLGGGSSSKSIAALGNDSQKTAKQVDTLNTEMDQLGQSTVESAQDMGQFASATKTVEGAITNVAGDVNLLDTNITSLKATANNLNLNNAFNVTNIGTSVTQIAKLALGFGALYKVAQLANRGLQQIRFTVQNLVGTAFQAAAEYENLALSLTALQRIELRNLGAEAITGMESFEGAVQANVDSLLSWVRALSIASPFEELAIANVLKFATALGFTTEKAKVVTQATTDWAAATGSSAAQMESIIRALGQMQQSSTLAKEELNQLRDAGFGQAVDVLAKSFGVDIPTFLEAVSDKAIDAKVAVAELVSAMQRDYGGAAAAATQTLSGLLSTFQSLRKSLLREALLPVFDVFRPLLAEFANADAINSLLDQATEFGNVLAGYVQVAVENVVYAFGTLKAIWDAIPDSIKTLGKDTARFIGILAGALLVAAGLQAAFAALAGAFVLLINPVSIVIASFTFFGSRIREIVAVVSDTLIRLQSVFAVVFAPLSPILQNVVNLFVNMVSGISTTLGNFVSTVFTYGENIGISFANGIVSAVTAVVNAIAALVNTIAYWLQPGSPPRALPDIDQWGTAAANEFLGGFTEADFSLISDYTSTIEDLIGALDVGAANIDVDDLADDFANLINAFKQGEGSEEAIVQFMEELQKETGPLSDDFAALANEYIVLAQEQSKLSALTEEYNAALKETNSELDTLSNQKTAIEQRKELENINRVLNSNFATAEQKEQAEIRRKEILAQQAKAEIEQQQAAVDEQKAAIDLIKQRIGLDKKLTDQTDAVTPGAAGGSSDSTGGLGKIAKIKKLPVVESIEKLGEGLSDAIAPATNLRDALATLEVPKLNIGDIFNEAQAKVTARIDELKSRFEELGITTNVAKKAILAFTAAIAVPILINKITAIGAGLRVILKFLAPIAATSVAGIAAITLIGGALVLFADAVTPETLTAIGNSLRSLSSGIATFATSFQSGLGGDTDVEGFTSLQEAFDGLGTLDVATFAANLGVSVSAIRETLLTNLTTLGTTISGYVNTYVITPFLGAFNLQEDPTVGEFDARPLIIRVRDGVLAALTSVGGELITAIQNFITTNIFTPFSTAFTETDGNLAEQMLAGVSAIFTTFVASLPTIFTENVIVTAINDNIIQPFKDTFATTTLDGEVLTFVDRLKASILAALQSLNISLTLSDYISFDSGIFTSITTAFNTFKSSIPTNIFDTFAAGFDRFVTSFTESEIGASLANLAGEVLIFTRNIIGLALGVAGLAAVFLAPIFQELPSIFGNIIDIIAGVLGAINSFINIFIQAFTGGDIRGALESFNDSIDTLLSGIFGLLEDAINIIINFIVNIAGLFGVQIDEIGLAMARSIATFAGQIPEYIRTAFNLAGIYIAAFFTSLGIAVQLIVSEIGSVFTNFEGTFTTALGNIGAFFTTIYDSIIETLTNISAGFVAFVEEFTGVEIPNPFEAFVTVITGIVDVITEIKDAVLALPTAFATLDGITTIDFQPIKDLGDALFVIPELVQTLAEAFNITINNPFDLLATVLATLASAPSLVIESLNLFLSFFTTYQIPNPFASLKEVMDSLPTALSTLRSGFEEFKAFFDNLTFENPFAGIGENVRGLFGGGSEKDSAKAAGEDVRSAYVEGLSSSSTTVAVNAANVIDSDISTFEAAGKESGAAIAAGISLGLEESEVEGTDTYADKLSNAWKNIWGINSPSTVANEELGVPIAEGIIEGIDLTLEEETPAVVEGFVDTFATSIETTDTTQIGSNFISKLISSITDAVSAGGSSSGEVISSLLTIDETTVINLQTTFSTLFAAIIEALEAFVEVFMDIFDEFLETLYELLEQLFSDIIEQTKDTLDQVIALLVAFSVQVIQILTRLMQSVEAVMRQFENIMREAARDGIDGFLDELSNLGDAVLAELRSQLDAIKEDILDYTYEYGRDIGESLIDGIVQGIRENTPAAVSAIERAVAQMVDAGREAADIQSPSKVFRDKVGLPIMQGLAQGIFAGGAYAANAMIATVNTTINAAKKRITESALTVPISAKYSGLKDSLPALQQDVNLNTGNYAGIANMQAMSSAGIVNNTNNYSLSMRVNERTAPKVQKHFNRMQHLRI